MKTSKGRKDRDCVHATANRQEVLSRSRGEEGQGLVEAAVAFLFLLTIILVMFEMVIIFNSYIALLNTSVQGAVYAAGRPNIQPGDAEYDQYVSIMQAEALAGGLSWTDIGVDPPQLPNNVSPGEPITVTVQYTLTTFASEIVFPMFERFGLPAEYHISARTAVPIR
jgi:Flp pilus assembly protein TadG